MKKFISKVIFLPILISNTLVTYAQKLPTVQKTSLRAPSNLKIDGRATEWDNHFQAYNKSTEVFYTISNNDSNLYLTIKATNSDIISKLIGGGITFTINNLGKKDDKNGIAITFPAYDKHYGNLHFINMKDKPTITNDTVRNRIRADSFMHAVNKQLASISKMIGVAGIKSITDSTISIYNETGVKAIAFFDDKVNYIYKLAVPIKYLGLDIAGADKFIYNIKLNGATANNATIQLSSSGRFLDVYQDNKPSYVIPATPQYMGIAYATDFWGEYTLAKK